MVLVVLLLLLVTSDTLPVAAAATHRLLGPTAQTARGTHRPPAAAVTAMTGEPGSLAGGEQSVHPAVYYSSPHQ